MAATARRLNISRNFGTRPQAEAVWLIHGATDYEDALTALEAEIDETLDGLNLRDYGLGEAYGGGSWPGFARYMPSGWLNATQPKASEPLDLGESITTYDTQGGTQRILSSLQTMAGEAGTGYATTPNFSNAVNVAGDTVEGVEVDVPRTIFTHRTVLASAFVTSSYRALVEELTGTVNNATFAGYAAGEVKFLGARLSQRKSNDWDADFAFARSKNQTGITLGGKLVDAIDKDGWDYLWILYEDKPDTVAMTLVKAVRAAYVERVYPRANLGALLP